MGKGGKLHLLLSHCIYFDKRVYRNVTCLSSSLPNILILFKPLNLIGKGDKAEIFQK